jgi:hypothetical protein
MRITRRTFLVTTSATVGAGLLPGIAATHSLLHVSKDANCGCCSKWVKHLQAEGFQTEVKDVTDMTSVKSRLLVPPELYSCHTAQIDGYVIEGHVPAAAIRRLLLEKPKALGLAVRGMPVGSPGMESPDTLDEDYEVILFDHSQRKVYARYKGMIEVRS